MTNEQLYDRLSAFVSDNKRALFDRLAPQRTRHITVVLEDIYQAHNASAVVRTADLLGIQDMHIIENRNKYTVNPDVTLGSSKWVDMHRYREATGNTMRCVRKLKEQGYRIVVTSPHAPEVTPATIALDRPMAFCFGTELTGASEELMANADMQLRIPMYGFTESYNISVSAAIVLYTVMERLRNSTVPWQLPHEQLLDLKLAWARKVVHSAAHLEAHFRAGEMREQG
ncbi:MAG: RNA methyltransferase [Flavobacteriales bacterium]|jgi:tRNA (guanosine-2'-O-)-methyltransferase|nr:RNA methyltransferase [Flavobacteriales bacterium]MBK9514935.1 RNA methyltransferase [Flavobacteriales bacterium]